MDQDVTPRIDPVVIHRELSAALERTEQATREIETCLEDAERELEDIKRSAQAANQAPSKA